MPKAVRRVAHRTTQERTALDVLLHHVAVEDHPQEAAKDYGIVRMVLELSEGRLRVQEMLAASHARCLGRTLVTGRARELARAKGMVAESWVGRRSTEPVRYAFAGAGAGAPTGRVCCGGLR